MLCDFSPNYVGIRLEKLQRFLFCLLSLPTLRWRGSLDGLRFCRQPLQPLGRGEKRKEERRSIAHVKSLVLVFYPPSTALTWPDLKCKASGTLGKTYEISLGFVFSPYLVMTRQLHGLQLSTAAAPQYRRGENIGEVFKKNPNCDGLNEDPVFPLNLPLLFFPCLFPLFYELRALKKEEAVKVLAFDQSCEQAIRRIFSALFFPPAMGGGKTGKEERFPAFFLARKAKSEPPKKENIFI